MGTYKVIQDIEADDKLIGWMTPRQAIYATIVVISGAIGFFLVTKGVWWAAIPLLPHTILFAVLAGPFVHDQPVELWLLARIQFFLKPRKRVWDQSGISELVTITVPKKVERVLTDGLSQTEVRSRLQVLANVIDSRGWSTKNINVNPYGQTAAYATPTSDRLVTAQQLPREVPAIDVTDQEDILDEQMNPTALHLQQMIEQSSQARRQQVIHTMHHPVKKPAKKDEPTQQWFVDNSDGQATSAKTTSTKTRGKTTAAKRTQRAARAGNPAQPAINPVVQQLANNDDLNISTIARQAHKAADEGKISENEVVISLH